MGSSQLSTIDQNGQTVQAYRWYHPQKGLALSWYSWVTTEALPLDFWERKHGVGLIRDRYFEQPQASNGKEKAEIGPANRVSPAGLVKSIAARKSSGINGDESEEDVEVVDGECKRYVSHLNYLMRKLDVKGESRAADQDGERAALMAMDPRMEMLSNGFGRCNLKRRRDSNADGAEREGTAKRKILPCRIISVYHSE
jgi:hypothetical protein